MAIQRLLLSGQPAPVFKETVETFYEATGCKVEFVHLGKGLPWVDLRLPRPAPLTTRHPPVARAHAAEPRSAGRRRSRGRASFDSLVRCLSNRFF